MVNWNIISKESRRSMLTFITTYYPCEIVESIKRIKDKYKIRLLNGKTLSFNEDGSFVKNYF